MKSFVAALAAALLAFGCGSSERPSARVAPQPVPAGGVWIADVAVLDVATGEVVPAQDVRLAGDRIASISPAGGDTPPDGALVISGAGATLVPGLVDMHGHVYTDVAPTWKRGFPDAEANLHAYLYAGVTTVFDPGDSSDAVARRERIARGELVGPHVYTAGPIHTIGDGHPIALVKAFAPAWIAWYLAPRVAVALEGPEHAREAADAVAAQGVDAVKLVIDAIPLDAPVLGRETAAALVARAREHGLRTVAHIGTTRDAIDAAEAGVALWVHAVYKERIPAADVARLAAYDIPVVATIEVFDRYARAIDGPRVPTPLERETYSEAFLDSFYPPPDDFELGALESWLELAIGAVEARSENVRRLHDAGVVILAGADAQSGVFPGPGLHRELANLVRAGLTPAEAIRAATLDAARWLQEDDDPDFGVVAVGRRADLLLVAGDPTSDIERLAEIREVILAGVPLQRTPVSEVR